MVCRAPRLYQVFLLLQPSVLTFGLDTAYSRFLDLLLSSWTLRSGKRATGIAYWLDLGANIQNVLNVFATRSFWQNCGETFRVETCPDDALSSSIWISNTKTGQRIGGIGPDQGNGLDRPWLNSRFLPPWPPLGLFDLHSTDPWSNLYHHTRRHAFLLYVSEPPIQHDSSWSTDILSHALSFVCERCPDLELRSTHLKLHADNSSKELKHNTAYRLLGALCVSRRVRTGELNEDIDSHEDIHQVFSALARFVEGQAELHILASSMGIISKFHKPWFWDHVFEPTVVSF